MHEGRVQGGADLLGGGNPKERGLRPVPHQIAMQPAEGGRGIRHELPMGDQDPRQAAGGRERLPGVLLPERDAVGDGQAVACGQRAGDRQRLAIGQDAERALEDLPPEREEQTEPRVFDDP
jgi:hypothetical protein